MLKNPVSDFEIEMHSKLKDKTIHYSRYAFLMAHNGIRPNCLHGMMGTTGCGKSTLLKCIITEAAAGCRVLAWISEEDIVEYQELINELDKSVLNNINFVEEKHIPLEYLDSQEKFFEYFEQMVEESDCDIVFIDNITTSSFYNSRFGFIGQQRTAEYLKNFVKSKCSVFYISHTRSEVTDNYGNVTTASVIVTVKEHTSVLPEGSVAV